MLSFIYINYPNNPTGAVATKAFYEKLVAWAKTYEVGVVSDLAMELWVIRAMRILASCQRLVLKMWALSSILSQKLLIWLVGVWPFRLGMTR